MTLTFAHKTLIQSIMWAGIRITLCMRTGALSCEVTPCLCSKNSDSEVTRITLILETLRTLKKGGTFAIHDLMTPRRYGDIYAFADRLRAMGYERVEILDTTDGLFLPHGQAVLLSLEGSKLLIGRK